MNRIAKIAALLIALTATFSFSQESTQHSEKDSLALIVSGLESKFETEQNTMKKTLDSLGNIEKNAFKEAEKFYRDFLSIFIAVVSLLVAILAATKFKSNNNLKEKCEEVNRKTLEIREEYVSKKDFKTQIDEILKKERKENEKKFNSAYKKIAEIYYISARDELSKVNESKDKKYKEKHWLFHLMCLSSLYYTLTRMSEFSDNEEIFMGLVKKFANEYNKDMPKPDIKFFWHFLIFIEHSEKINGAIFKEAKIIYNELLEIFDYDKITEYLKNIDFDKERVRKLLELAERYKDKEYLKKFNLNKPQEAIQSAS